MGALATSGDTATCYKPNDKLKTFLDERFQILSAKKNLESASWRKKGGGELSEDEIKRKHAEWSTKRTENSKKLRKSDVDKNRTLNNIIFPSMANLIYFAEALEMHPELREDFEDALKDLVGYRGKEAPLMRFIDALLTWNHLKEPDNFRVVLIHWLQDIITGKAIMVYPATLIRKGNELLDTPQSYFNHDMGRAEAWTNLMARTVTKETQPPSRSIQF